MNLFKLCFSLRRKTISFVAMLAMVFSIASTLAPIPSYADNTTESDRAESLTIKVGVGTSNNSNPTTSFTALRTFTPEEMSAMATTQETYSYFDSFPTVVYDCATGVILKDLLAEVGIDWNDVNRIYFYTTDITSGPYGRTYTKATLFTQPRYYFPLADESWFFDEEANDGEGTWRPADSGDWGDDPTAGAELVETMIAVKDNWKRYFEIGHPDFDTQDEGTRYRLLRGQTEDEYLNGTPTAPFSAKWIYEMDVQLASTSSYSLSLDQNELSLAAGETEQLNASFSDNLIQSSEIIWSSSDASVATVDSSGLVTANAAGSAVITAITKDDKFSATCNVTVTGGEPLSPPTLAADSENNAVGQAFALTFTDDEAWRSAINNISVNGESLTEEQYSINPGEINLAAEVFTEAGEYEIVVSASGYTDTVVTQTVTAAAPDNYTVTVDSSITGGSIIVNPDNGLAGSTIYIEVTPDSGKQLKAGSLQYTTDGITYTEITAEDSYSFVLPEANVSVTARFENIPNADSPIWEGTVDVSWYNQNDTEFYIDTPAKLAGLAAIVNGIYNEDCVVVGNSEYIVANVGGGTVAGSTDATWIYGADNFAGKTVYLTNDIDMGGIYDSASNTWSGPNYMPIGGQYCMTPGDGTTLIGSSWNGTFDGQGHTVSNIYCSRHAGSLGYGMSQSIGLFGRMGVHDNDPQTWYANPAIKNVAVSGYIYGNRSIGGIVGKNGRSNGSVIENCINYASVKNTDSKGVGGIAGAGWNSLVIKNCANFGEIYTSYSNAGGLVGSCEAKVYNSYNFGYVGASNANQAQSLGTNNGGAVWTNCYWLNGSSASNTAVYGSVTGSTITMIDTADEMKSAGFLASLNSSSDGKVWSSDTGEINNGYPVPSTWVTEPAIETGDLNGDGIIDIADINQLTDIFLGNANVSAEELAAADLNNDGTINIIDIMMIIRLANN